MAKVRFTADFDYRPVGHVVIGYLAGMELTVKQDCADQAIAAGKAVSLDRKRKMPNGGDQIGG